MTQQITSNVIRIGHKDRGKSVLFGPADNDYFVLQVSETLAAGAQYAENQRLTSEFGEKVRTLLQTLADWYSTHQQAIDRAYLGWDGRAFSLVVVQNQLPINEQLESDLIELDLLVAGSTVFDSLTMNVMLLPMCDEDSVNTFIPPNRRMSVLPNASH